MGFDPAYRTGCKLAMINETGYVLAKAVIYPHKPASQAQRQAAADKLAELIEEYQIEVIAIGNGTASRESEQFVAQVIQEHQLAARFIVVSEAGLQSIRPVRLLAKNFLISKWKNDQRYQSPVVCKIPWQN